MTNRFAVLEEEHDQTMAQLTMYVPFRNPREGQAVGGHSGQQCRGECVASQLVARDPRLEMGHYGQKKIKLGGEMAA